MLVDARLGPWASNVKVMLVQRRSHPAVNHLVESSSMDIAKRLSASGASEGALSRIEMLIGAKLPGDYRQFMSNFNGGQPEPSGFAFAVGGGQGDSSVRYFLTLDEREERYTVQEFLGRYADRIPRKMLPIACGSFGNLVLLDVGAKSPGTVCFWDHEKEGTDNVVWDNLAIIAPSFVAFLDALE